MVNSDRLPLFIPVNLQSKQNTERGCVGVLKIHLPYESGHISPHCAMRTGSLGLLSGLLGTFRGREWMVVGWLLEKALDGQGIGERYF